MSDKILKLSQARTLYQDLRERIDALPTDSDIPEVPVQDVQVNGTSIITNGVANVPVAANNTFGVVSIYPAWGIMINSSGSFQNRLAINGAATSDAKDATSAYKPVVPVNQHYSVFYGLAKAAGDTTQKASSNTVGNYTDGAKAAIQNMLGITDLISTEEVSTATAAHALNSTFMMGGKLHRATAAITIGDAVEVGTNCEVVKADEVFVKNTDYATRTIPGIIKIDDQGLRINASGVICLDGASTTQIKAETASNYAITPAHQHESVFFGLSKVAGVDLKNETVTLGTYPNTSKIAIRKMIDALGVNNIHDGLSVYMDVETGDWVLTANVQDVQIDGTSIVNNGVANLQKATASTYGLVKCAETAGAANGIVCTSLGYLAVASADVSSCKAGATAYRPISPNMQDAATFYGLAKAAGANMASSSNAVGTYTETAKSAIRSMLGATSSSVIAVQDEQPTDTDTKVWLPETEPTGIEIPTYAEFQALDATVVKKTDLGDYSNYGIVKLKQYGGLQFDSSTGGIKIDPAGPGSIKAGTSSTYPLAPNRQHEVVFFGLSKAAGLDLASETITVGTYPATASAAIRSMLGAVGDIQVNGTSVVSNGVANIPLAGNDPGLVCFNGTFGVVAGNNSVIAINKPSSGEIKNGTNMYKPIVPQLQHEATFYGLAKAAGDTTQSASSNAVGTYTTEAKAAIHTMLGIDPASIAAQVDIPLVETVSGTTPTITGQPNVRYVCGEVSTISITPPASGSVDVIFESGSTATTMTVPSTVKWPAWFDAETLEANTTYEVLITDGIYGSVMTWAT